jgi:hypothetical protein
METPPPLRVTLELRRAGEPISGWIQAEGAVRGEFVGLMDLVAALESLRAGAAGYGRPSAS